MSQSTIFPSTHKNFISPPCIYVIHVFFVSNAKLSSHPKVSFEDDNSIDTLESEIVSHGLPAKALAELSTPLYEKVVCNIPFLVMDKSQKLVTKDRLSKIRYI